MRHALLSTILVALCLFSCKTTRTAEENYPSDEYEKGFTFDFIKKASLLDVVDKAEAENKLVFLDIYTDWCLPCKIMEEEVFTNEPLGEFFNDNFISYKVNAEKDNGPDLLTLYNVEAYPTLLFLDTKGRVLEVKKGLAYSRELKEMALRSIDINAENSATD